MDFFLYFNCPGGIIAFNIHCVEATFTVGIAVNVGQHQTGFQLSPDLLLNGMRKLHSAIGIFQQLALLFIDQRIKGYGIDNEVDGSLCDGLT